MNTTIDMPVVDGASNVVTDVAPNNNSTKKPGRPSLNIEIPSGIFTTDQLAETAKISRVTAVKRIVNWLENGLITEVENPNLDAYEGKPGRRPVFYTKV